MTKQELREKAKSLGLTIGLLLRQPAIVRWYPPKPKGDEQEAPAFKWICESCGTLTNDGECDCTKFGRPGKFIPFEAKRS